MFGLRLYIFVLVLFVISTGAHAQASYKKSNFQLYGTGLSYKGELGNQFWDKYSLGSGFSYNRYISPSFDLGLHLSYESSKYEHENTDYFGTKISMGTVSLRLKMYGTILEENAVIGPYLAIGGGGMYARSEGAIEKNPFNNNFVTPVFFTGAGLLFKISRTFSVFSEVNHILTSSDKFDNLVASDNESFMKYSIGLGFSLGKAMDTDNDGVADKRDSCPDTPQGALVDKEGCPVDTDGDGVFDYQDKCPAEVGVANLRGCPDRDRDGMADKDDKCPDEPGPLATRGCPDTDSDGIPDKNDMCLYTPAGVQVGADGCPVDTDGDGVADYEDFCRNSAGTPGNGGCPELDERSQIMVDEKVLSEFDQLKEQKSYRQLLDSMVVILEKHPNHALMIKGHIDKVGSEGYNYALFRRRAQAMKEQLIEHGVQNSDRLMIGEYGKMQSSEKVNTILPKARTTGIRNRNRRVGFEINTADMKLKIY